MGLTRFKQGFMFTGLLVLVSYLALHATAAFAVVGTDTVSLSVDSQYQGDADSTEPAVSKDGRYVAFTSKATNLTSGINLQDRSQILLRDRITGATEVVSVNDQGEAGNHDSFHPAISGNGRYVAFTSKATNLSGQDILINSDVYLRDRVSKTTKLISKRIDGFQSGMASQLPAVSTDGSFIVFQSSESKLVSIDNNGKIDIFRYSISDGEVLKVSGISTGPAGANGHSTDPSVSGDGNVVAFTSDATNLTSVPIADNNGQPDIYVATRTEPGNPNTWLFERASLRYDQSEIDNYPSQNSSISDNGRYVVFEANGGSIGGVGMIDPNVNAQDIYLRDLVGDEIKAVSVTENGLLGNGVGSVDPVISGDGKYVAFSSASTNLLPGGIVSDSNSATPDIFLRDVATGINEVVSVSAGMGNQSNSGSLTGEPAINYDASQVVFSSTATNLTGASQVNGNTGTFDIFLRTRVDNVAPVGGFSASVNGLSLSVDGSGSFDLDGDQLDYQWDFGDGVLGSGVQASHTYGSAGTYTVTLTVSDPSGLSDTTSKSVTVVVPSSSDGANGSSNSSGTSSSSSSTVTTGKSGSGVNACFVLSGRAAKARSLKLGRGLRASFKVTVPKGSIGGKKTISGKLLPLGSKSSKRKVLRSIKQVVFSLNGKSAGRDRKSPYTVRLKNSRLKVGSNRLKVTVQPKNKKSRKRSVTLTLKLNKTTCK